MAQPEVVAVLVEVPRGSFLKRELRDRAMALDYVSPLPSPFNYGCVPDSLAADGDPLDVVVLGPRLALGARVDLPVRGVVRFDDAGQRDDKLVASREPPTAWQRWQVERFFSAYAHARQLLNRLGGLGGETRFQGVTWK